MLAFFACGRDVACGIKANLEIALSSHEERIASQLDILAGEIEPNPQQRIYEQKTEVSGWVAVAKVGKKVIEILWRRKKDKQAEQSIDPNKLHHIFGQSKHNLGPLVQRFGSQEAAFIALQAKTQQAVTANKIKGVFTASVNVGGLWVVVKGKVIGGIAKIGTAWMLK